MQCSNCGHHNTEDAKFCARCGSGLTATCGVCGSVAPADAAFCTNCGATLSSPPEAGDSELTRYVPQELLAKLESARAGRAMAGERRIVTMLFADITGSTAAAEQLDPEDWAEIINGAFEHLIAPVYRYEGTLARLQGDAVLAFFGAPIAHEDDPVRAIRAGLEVIEAIGRYRAEIEARWGLTIEARVGIHTGLVVVGEVGSDLRVEYTALGDAINLAARMEQTATPGTVQVTEHTRSLVGDLFEFEDLGPIEVKGKAEPVATHRAVGFVGERLQALPRVLIGRAAELSRLGELRSQLGSGVGWIASVTAEAGVGKSSLLRVFHDESAADTTLAHRYDEPGEMPWMTGAGRSYDTASPFAAVRDLLRRWWGLADAADPFERVQAAIEAAGADFPDAAALLSHVAGVELTGHAEAFISALDSPILHSRTGSALMAYLEAVAEDRPTVIVLEDVHWSDDLSLALFEAVMGLTERLPIGLVVAMRPYREDRSWRIHQVADQDHPHRYHHLPLSPLARDDGAVLLDTLLGDLAVDGATRQRILDRSAGNPLFLEEMVRTLRETGSPEALAVPESLAAILTARLDRLDDSARFVVQMASVIGSEFDRATLGALLERTSPDREIVDLLRRGILVETGRGMLAFRHVLMQEAAYETILRRTRKELHRVVADHLVSRDPDAVQEIGRHLTEAGDTDAAFPYLVEAGVRATRAMALADAIRILSDAIDHTPLGADPAMIVKAHDALGTAHSLVPDLSAAAAAYQSLYDYGERESSPTARVAALNRLGFATAALGGDFAGAANYLSQARALAEEVGDDIGLAEYHMNSCFVSSMGGDLQAALGHDQATVELGERSGAEEVRLTGMLRRTLNYAALLELDQAEASAEAALAASDEVGAEENRAIIEGIASSIIHYWRGDPRRALEKIDTAQETLDRFGSFYSAINQIGGGRIAFELGEPESALSRYVEAQRAGRRLGRPFVVGTSAAGMAHVYASAGITEPLASLRDEALTSLQQPSGEFLASDLWAHLGWAGLVSGNVPQAQEDFVRGLGVSSIASFTGRPRLLLGRVMALIGLGGLDDAATVLDEARAFISTRGLVAGVPLLSWVEGEYLMATDRLEEASQPLAIAHESALGQGRRCTLLPILGAGARLATRTGDTESATRHRTAATELIETIVGSIVDQTLANGLRDRWLADLDRGAIRHEG
jgi:class 3 adenylate cyclase/tetratricopeptide (TPR) repeat protein